MTNMTKEQFKSRRKALGLTQLQLAKEFGVAEYTIQSLEQGKYKIRGIYDLAFRYLEMRKATPSDPVSVSLTREIPYAIYAILYDEENR